MNLQNLMNARNPVNSAIPQNLVSRGNPGILLKYRVFRDLVNPQILGNPGILGILRILGILGILGTLRILPILKIFRIPETQGSLNFRESWGSWESSEPSEFWDSWESCREGRKELRC